MDYRLWTFCVSRVSCVSPVSCALFIRFIGKYLINPAKNLFQAFHSFQVVLYFCETKKLPCFRKWGIEPLFQERKSYVLPAPLTSSFLKKIKYFVIFLNFYLEIY